VRSTPLAGPCSRQGVLAAALLSALLVLACSSAATRSLTPGLDVWLEGPVRWLMTPEEVRGFRRVRDNVQAVAEIEAFWRRRDPTPEDQENPFRTTFQERAIAADRLYAEGNRRGSLSDRGRALVLLGPPRVLRYRQRTVPALAAPDGAAHPGGRTGLISEEVWGYAPEDLPAALRPLLEPEEQEGGIELVFATEGRRTYLTNGEGYLELMRKAARQPN